MKSLEYPTSDGIDLNTPFQPKDCYRSMLFFLMVRRTLACWTCVSKLIPSGEVLENKVKGPWCFLSAVPAPKSSTRPGLPSRSAVCDRQVCCLPSHWGTTLLPLVYLVIACLFLCSLVGFFLLGNHGLPCVCLKSRSKSVSIRAGGLYTQWGLIKYT